MSEQDYKVRLIITGLHGRSDVFELTPGTYTLGRSEDCDIRFPDGARTVSRRHAQIEVAPGKVVVRDLDSRGGTMVNGGVITEREVEDEDVINIASFGIRVDIPSAKGRRKESAYVLEEQPELAAKVEVLQSDLQTIAAKTEALMEQIGRRIIGQESVLKAIWASILAQGHCLLIGVPGLAKTQMVLAFSEALDVRSSRIQFTPDLMPADILGSEMIQRDEEGQIRRRFDENDQGPVFTNLLLADEINRTPPKTQAALLEVMQEYKVTIGKRTISLSLPFCVIATQNPIEQEGTYPLPEAQLDRFLLCIVLEYPDRDQEVDIILRTSTSRLSALQRIFEHPAEEIKSLQNTVENISVSREMASYAADLARATRPGNAEGKLSFVGEMVDWGAGPRAGQALIRVAKAYAAMDGRPAIAHDDIREVALPVMRHRLSCNYRARAEGMDEDAVIRRILELVTY